tara:strand:+ start:153 stop:278 length:126 start_codon:yes stop_codon:yes gene_type:complete
MSQITKLWRIIDRRNEDIALLKKENEYLKKKIVELQTKIDQ